MFVFVSQDHVAILVAMFEFSKSSFRHVNVHKTASALRLLKIPSVCVLACMLFVRDYQAWENIEIVRYLGKTNIPDMSRHVNVLDSYSMDDVILWWMFVISFLASDIQL